MNSPTLITYSPSSGSVVLHRHAAARAERQPVVVLVLRVVRRGAEHARAGHDVGGVADRQRGDLGRRRRVALEQRRRHVQHLADVVEAVGRLVGRQQRRHVHVERQQIADRVGVLGAVQTMDRRMAGKRRRRGRAIDGGLEPRAPGRLASRRPAAACRRAAWRRSAPCGSRVPRWRRRPARATGSCASSARPPVLRRWLWQVTQ